MIGVNISTALFKTPLGLERLVFATLAQTRLRPTMLELEINESTLIDLSPENGEMIQRLRRAGVRFSLDDFETGHSSLNYLLRFSVGAMICVYHRCWPVDRRRLSWSIATASKRTAPRAVS